MKFKSCILILTFLINSSLYAQELIAPSLISLPASKLNLLQHASVVNEETIKLTPAQYAKRGVAETPLICASEYKLDFELNPGNGTGAGFTIFKIRESRYPVFPSIFDNYEPAKLTSDGRPNVASFLHFDTYRDYDPAPGLYQRDDNSIYYANLRVNPDNTTAFPFLIDESIPFRMIGAGWFKVSLHIKDSLLNIKVFQNGTLKLEKDIEHYSFKNEKHLWAFGAWTGIASSEQSIRNIVFEGIQKDDCVPKLKDEELTEELELACGSNKLECNQLCYKSTMQPLLDESRITAEQFERFLTQCTDLICKGRIDEASNAAFNAGVASIDQDSIRKEAFNEGVKSLNLESIKNESYKAGYEAGFKAGKESVQCSVKEDDKLEQDKKVKICRKNQTLKVSSSALKAHLKRGYTKGACSIKKDSKPQKSLSKVKK